MLDEHLLYCYRKGDSFQDSGLTLRNELSEDTHVLTKQKNLLGRGAQVESRRVREPRRTIWHVVAVLRFMVAGLVSGLSLANNSDSGSFLVANASLSQDRFQQEGFWEVGRTYALESPCSFWVFLNSNWWQLVSSTVLTRIPSCKIAHISEYYHFWPGQVISVN